MRFTFTFILLIVTFFVTTVSNASADNVILCASTTSTQNSGLYEHILPQFEKKTGIKVRVIAVGTGAALEIGKRGDADVVIVHSREDELRMVQEGWFVGRMDLMYNDFVIVGPLSDSARIAGLVNATDALSKIAASESMIISRGDNSGTHKKELRLWKESGVSPVGAGWYLEVGQGMAKTLRITGEKQAYTLTDRGTYLSLIDKERLELNILVEKDPSLFNQYGAMAVNPEKHPHAKYREAMWFIDWLISEEGQQAIASFKDARGNQLFYPNAR
jgi:tungstate transport system substrate-binding protein